MTSDWNALRQAMPVTRRWAYFDHAAVAPMPSVAQVAIEQWMHECVESGDVHWLAWEQRREATRQTAAAMLNAEPDEIALTWSTTAGINIVAEGFPWRSGDNVVTLADEYPSNQYPWLHLADRGVETRRVPVEECRPDLDRIAAACDARTRVVSISWVGFVNGYRQDLDQLAALAHDRGALLFIDGIQATGVFPLDVKKTPIDFLAADGHKWMLGPEGAGLFYTRREHLSLLRPIGVGWNSVVGRHDFSRIDLTIRPDAARYEGGSANMVGHLALGASLQLLCGYGQETLGRRIVEMTDHACDRLRDIGAVIATPREPGHESGIVLFDLPGRDLTELRGRCLERGVVLSVRGGRLRISVHAYNDEADIARLVEAIR